MAEDLQLHPLLVSVLSAFKSYSSIIEAVEASLDSGDWSSESVLTCIEDCLAFFLQLNWTGPPVPGLQQRLEELLDGEGLQQLNNGALHGLTVDGVSAYTLCDNPLFLHIANVLLQSPLILQDRKCLRVTLLAMRCSFVQQRLLIEHSSLLWKTVSASMETVQKLALPSVFTRSKQSELYLELGHISLYYLKYDQAKSYFEKAGELAGVQATLTGVLGKRTKFQERDVAQLVLQVVTQPLNTIREKHPPLSSSPHDTDMVADFPREVSLDDDTVLDKLKLAAAVPSSQTLEPLQQASLLGWCCYYKKTTPLDSLSNEEMEAYLNCVLERPQCWVVQTHALFLKALLGRHRSRLQQRNMQQLEELVNSVSRTQPDVLLRRNLLQSVPLPPVWTLQKELAAVLMSLGCHGSAIEILTRLQIWEELALCYLALGRKAKASEVIQEQLDKRPTPTLLCVMGDITQDHTYYQAAWEESGHHSARAQRSLGLWYLKKKQLPECVRSLQLSLNINPLQEGLWFSLGCAASQVCDVALSIKAWHQTVTLDPHHAEAWNNLAGAYLKKKDKVKAQRLFKEAVRCSYDNAKIWENYLVVSVDLGCWEESVRACHRLLELECSHAVDVEILAILVRAVTQGPPDQAMPPAVEHRQLVGTLLTRLVGRGSVTAEVWEQCAKFHLSSTDLLDHMKGVIELRKAQRMARLMSNWDKDLKGLARISQLTLDYCRAGRDVYGKTSHGCNQKEAVLCFSSARLCLQGVLAKAKSFGLDCTPEVDLIVKDLEAENGLLLQLLT